MRAAWEWWRRRREIREAKYNVKIETLKAEAALAPFKVKSDIEWDMKWADRTGRGTWRDELLVVVWLIPTIGIFVPGLREHIREGFDLLRTVHEDGPFLFLAGWGVIFAATFGIKSALHFMLPKRYASLVSAMGSIPQDVPDYAMRPLSHTPPVRTENDGPAKGPPT